MNLCACGCGQKCHKQYNWRHAPKNNLCQCRCGQFCRDKFVHGHNGTGKKRPPEFGAKISLRMKGKPKSEEHKKNIGLSQLGKKHSAERNARKSARQMGHIFSAEARKNISLAKKGKPGRKHTESEKHQLSISLTGKNKYVRTDEMKKNMSIAHLGQIQSEESNLKRSATLQKTWSEHGEEILARMVQHKKWSRFPYIAKSGIVIKMRSSWEFAFGTYLDSLNIVWQYEPRSFLLSNGRRYIPDFFLPETNEWREIKGWMSPQAQEKLDLFTKDYPNEKLIILRNIPGYIKNKGAP